VAEGLTQRGAGVRVKICGLTNREDAELATHMGADYLGVIFVPDTPRFLTVDRAAEVLDFSPRPPAIGVFADASAEKMVDAAERLGLAGLQLHGAEEPALCDRLPPIRIKVFRVHDAQSLARVDDYETEAVMCDTFAEDRAGGTGRVFDHSLVVELARRRRLFLSGGLTPDNVVDAVREVQPFAVDVSSGVEASPGRKNPAKLENFFATLRRAGLR
jgi:phosphoribosylanthranilate isomerase